MATGLDSGGMVFWWRTHKGSKLNRRPELVRCVVSGWVIGWADLAALARCDSQTPMFLRPGTIPDWLQCLDRLVDTQAARVGTLHRSEREAGWRDRPKYAQVWCVHGLCV